MTMCRTCKYLDVPPDAAGRIVPRKQFTYPCAAPILSAEAIGLPRSVTAGTGSFHWPPAKSHMLPDWGEGCPAYVQREPKPKDPDR